MKTIQYDGPFEALQLGDGTTFAANSPVRVEDDLAESLLCRDDFSEVVPEKKAPKEEPK